MNEKHSKCLIAGRHCRKSTSCYRCHGRIIINLDDSSKLFLYSKLKTDIKLEDYLKLTKKINNRQLLTKFRTSDHPLEIELGRYKKIPKHQRLCKTCKVLDDEIHFFLQCQINNNLRNVLINNIKK